MFQPKKLVTTFVVSLLASSSLCGVVANAADAKAAGQKPAEELEVVFVTGSLIPRAKTETSVTTTSISADDIQARGYATVADALQQSSFSSGSVQGAQFTNGFTPGAQTLSMFGLSPSYVKYLIDGRPMSDYPALYNGTDTITNISGIPEALVERIDILPGGQSSLYGSDAIAGVVNVILKKKLDGAVLDTRYGTFEDNGGIDRRISFADSFSLGKVSFLAGIQYENTDPIWGWQRDLTKQYNVNGTSAQTAERDYVVIGSANNYYFLDPSNCANVASQYGGSVTLHTRPGRGQYCGTTNAGLNTISNGNESVQGYVHANAEVNSRLSLYGDVLVNHETTKFSTGSPFWSTSVNYGYIYDPNLDDFINLQHIFSPDEYGGAKASLNSDTTNAARVTFGAQGSLGVADWTYDVGYTHTQQKLIELTHVLWNNAVENFFLGILGPNLGTDPYYDYYSTFTPDYAAFYSPLTPAQFASFSGIARSYSSTFDNMLRAQFTNASLFDLRGGPAGAALVVEGGNQGWDYTPDPAFLNGGTWGYTSVAGDGHRSRYAVTGEVRLPVLKRLTVTGSARYDNYSLTGSNVTKGTYNLGLEYRPIESLLLRGRYGTAFKAPTLSDEFQGQSGFYTSVTDYYRCQQAGYTSTTIGDCPYYYTNASSVFGTTQGNTALKPITAKVWDLGVVWSPTGRLSFNLDYLHWGISDEVNQQSADLLMQTENQCRQGILSITSAACVAALAQVQRDPSNVLVSISTPKINVSNETVNAFVAEAHYLVGIGGYGSLEFQATWNDMLTHTQQVYPGDPYRDNLRDPTWSTEFKSKVNGAVTWKTGAWTNTLNVDRHGRTPNNVASIFGYAANRAGTLAPWVVANISTKYQWSDKLQLSLNIDNWLNEMPPVDKTYNGLTASPYNIFNYSVYGRSYYFQVNYKFGH